MEGDPLARTPKKAKAKKRAAPRRSRRKAQAAKQNAATPGVVAQPATKEMRPAGYRAKIRMYRHGLGDCFLISLPRTDRSDRPFYLMIDCGVVLGTPDPGPIMKRVMNHIHAETDGEIDILVATHEHWDHVSGFYQAKDEFEPFTIKELWLAWTEDSDDELTKKLRKEKGLALDKLRMGLSHLQLAGDSNGAAQLGSVLEFFGMAKSGTTTDALDIVKKKVSKPRYFDPEKTEPIVPAGTTTRFYVLGPPHDEKLLRKINPSKSNKETYGLAMDGLGMFMDGAGTALAERDDGRPFDQQYEIPFVYAQTAPDLKFFRDRYWQPQDKAPDDWRRIDGNWLGGASEMALQLDSLTNNTSLVLALELEAGGDVLLFAADAQVGNWLSWEKLSWQVDGKTVTAPDLLKRAIFYKVGHHGSHNATLKENGLEQMVNLRVAMIPVDQKMAANKGWGKMPLDELVDALGKRAKGVVLRVDKPKPANTAGENVVEDPLFYEVTF
jgi:hypothetical protein